MKHKTFGAIVGANAKIEYLLPIFYLHFRLHCDLPIVFCDFGMTSIGRQFCEKRGAVIEITDSLWNDEASDPDEIIKLMWFKKPLACQKAPFDINLWLDLDCKIEQNIDDIFSYLTPGSQLAIRKETKEDTVSFQRMRQEYPEISIYNSGVMIFEKESPLINAWVEHCHVLSQTFRGDQEVLSHLLMNRPGAFSLIPSSYNCIFSHESLEELSACQIKHYIGDMKGALLAEYLQLEILVRADIHEP